MTVLRSPGWLRNNRFVQSVLTLVSATVVGQLIVVLATPLVTRLYTPDEFGVFAVFLAISSTILVVSSMRYELAIPLPRSDRNARLILDVALWITIAVAVLCVPLVGLFNDSVAMAFGIPSLSGHLWLLPVVILAAGSYKAFNYWAVRKKEFRLIGRTRIIQGSSNVAVQIGAGLANIGVIGLILGMLAGQAIGIVSLAAGSGVRARWRKGSVWQTRARLLLKKYHRFPKYDAPAAVVNVVSLQLPSALLAALFGTAVAGFYLLAQRVLSMPMTLVGQAVGQVLLGDARTAIADGNLSRVAIKIIGGLTVVIALPAVLLFLHADSIFGWVFGKSWHEAGTYASWMILGVSVQFIYSPISMVLVATSGQHLNLVIHTLMLLGKVAAVFYGYFLGKPLISIIGFSLVGGIGYAIAILVVVIRTRRQGMEY